MIDECCRQSTPSYLRKWNNLAATKGHRWTDWHGELGIVGPKVWEASHMWIIIFPFRPLSQRAAISHVMPPSWVWSSTDLRNVGNSLKLRKLGNPGRKIIQHRLFDRHTAEPVRGQATNRPQALTSMDSFNRMGTKHEDETNPAVSRPPTANTETGMQRQHY